MFGDARKSAAEANFLTSKPREVMRLAKASLTDSSSSTIEIRSFALADTQNAPLLFSRSVLNFNTRERREALNLRASTGHQRKQGNYTLVYPRISCRVGEKVACLKPGGGTTYGCVA